MHLPIPRKTKSKHFQHRNDVNIFSNRLNRVTFYISTLCNTHCLAMQKRLFCTPKTILLQCKNHTFEWRLCNIQIMKMLRTFRECATNTHETHHETHRKMSTFTHKTPNEHTARRRGGFIVPVSLRYQKRVSISTNIHFHIFKYVYSHRHTRIFVPHFVGVFVYAGTINMPLRLLTDCQ